MSKRRTRQPLCTITPESTQRASLLRHIEALKLSGIPAYRAWCRRQGYSAALYKDWRLRRLELLRAERLEAHEHACYERNRHFRKLGLESVEDYEAWCRRHGFGVAVHKTEAQYAQETLAAEQERAARALVASRRLDRNPEEFLRAVYENRIAWSALRNAAQEKIAHLFAAVKNKPKTREALLRLMLPIGLPIARDAGLLTVGPVIPYLGLQPGNSFPDALLLLAQRHREWIRAPEDWKPESHNARRRFGSLVRHLLAHYDVPAFMDAAWFEGESETAQRHQDWFLYIADGQNIRTAALPIALTKRAAHYFLKAPRDLSIPAALRWAQTRGMGGSAALARALIGSRLAEILPDEPFWTTVVQFFINYPTLDPAQIGSIVDYLYHQKFASEEIFGPMGRVAHVGPPEPDLTMKGRTPAALLRRVEAWHRQLAQEAKRPPLEWARSGIGELHLLQREDEASETVTHWTLRELLSSRELQAEGRAMRNCVAAYAARCTQGGCSIWSIRAGTSGGAMRSVMTVEVNNAKRAVVQARGHGNILPHAAHAGPRLKVAAELMHRWAEREKLTVSRYAW
jgi:hypothetical protein